MGARPALSLTHSQAQTNQKLAKKNLWATGLLTFFLPFVGYLYTKRYALAGITFALWLVCAAASDEDLASVIVGFLMIGSTVENMVAVLRARSQQPHSEHLLPPPTVQDVRIELLKLAKHRGEMTLADCVITTGLPVEEVRSILLEFEQQDLMRSHNRESDGAVVYHVVI